MDGRTRFGRLAAVAGMTVALLAAGVAPAHAALTNTPDDTWMTNGQVRAMIRYGNYIYIGGKFTQVRSAPPGMPGQSFNAENLARIDATTGVGDATWTPDVTATSAAPAVFAMVAAGGEIWIGGDFTAVDGQPRQNLAAVSPITGVVDPGVDAAVMPVSGHGVRALAASATRVYAGGYFTQVDGLSRKRLAAFDLNGGLVPGWKPKADKRVFALALDCSGSTVFAGGQFRNAAGSDGVYAPRETVARFDPATGDLTPWAVPMGTIPVEQKVYDLAPTCSQLNVAYGKNNYAVAFSLTSGNIGTQLWRTTTSGNVQAITVADGKVVIGGHFQTIGRSARLRIAALNMSTGALDAWNPGVEGQWGGPWDLLGDGNHLYVGGQFTTVGGAPHYFFARFTV